MTPTAPEPSVPIAGTGIGGAATTAVQRPSVVSWVGLVLALLALLRATLLGATMTTTAIWTSCWAAT